MPGLLVVLTSIVGALIGAFVALGWASMDALLSVSTLTHDKAMGCIGISVVLANTIVWAMIVYDEFKY